MKKIGLIIVSFCLLSMLFAEPLELVGGKLKLVLYPETGGFSLYQLSDIGKNRYEPLIEDRNNSATSWFSVLVNGRIFKLARRSGKTIVAEPTADGARMIFTLTDDFEVVQEFSFLKNPATATPVAVKIVTTVENTSGKQGTFALKALFDTMLGETEGIHYLTNIRSRISSETRLLAGVDPDTVIVSKNTTQMMMFLLEGYGITRPEIVYATNWDRLNTLTWTPDFLEGRSFNTLYSVNDSALLFVWSEKILQPKEKVSEVVVLGTYVPEMISKPHAPAPIAPLPAPTPVPARVSLRQLKIEQLLSRIAEIEANPAIATDDELKRLNSELDSALRNIQE